MEVLCGGKFGEKRLWADHASRKLIFRTGEVQDLSAQEAELFRPHLSAEDQRHYDEVIAQRKEILGDTIDVRTELGIVANATGTSIERDRFHHPVAWPNEMPGLLAPKDFGGILEGRGVIEQTTYLQAPNDTSMGGGVYVTVHAENQYSRSIVSGKGHICNPDGTSTMIFRPYHLCGVETPYSILQAALHDTPTSGWEMEQHYDSFGRARQNLAAGTELHGAHDNKWETFLAPAAKLDATLSGAPIPYQSPPATPSRETSPPERS